MFSTFLDSPLWHFATTLETSVRDALPVGVLH
ncbi:hypothetical protein KL86PLE_40185 [uncultured Pleomorphomonas sp.]|uniref:Uncharacterized protein n=1 Tax=uncultured Pleomorphomonas sp. TaxID=442121 RepID=A0A212LFY1_9HYPH|nr:hypothetical protein KL86PLE_40185 [uncultured Pleomorphomonas sp.]